MKLFKSFVYFAVLVAAVVAMVRYFKMPEQNAPVSAQLEVWTCPTHRDLKFSSGGKCSMCGAELVKEEQ